MAFLFVRAANLFHHQAGDGAALPQFRDAVEAQVVRGDVETRASRLFTRGKRVELFAQPPRRLQLVLEFRVVTRDATFNIGDRRREIFARFLIPQKLFNNARLAEIADAFDKTLIRRVEFRNARTEELVTLDQFDAWDRA